MTPRNNIIAALRSLAQALRGQARAVRAGMGAAVTAVAHAAARFAPGAAVHEGVHIAGWYDVEYFNPDGTFGWRDRFPNLVTTVGKNALLDNHLAGSAYTAAWYLGLIGITSYTAVAAGDTMSSHAGWTESVVYSNSTRVAVSWNAASAGSKASTTCTFNINASDTIKGAFLTTGSAKSGTTGTLYSAGLFSGGDQAVSNGGTLNVTYTASA